MIPSTKDHRKCAGLEGVVQSSRRVKDNRPYGRACGILDPSCCQYSMVAKGL